MTFSDEKRLFGETAADARAVDETEIMAMASMVMNVLA
jgi:hypothetical protein